LQDEFNKDSILAKIETPWKYSFVDVTFEKYADYAKIAKKLWQNTLKC
jgi:hypothetical protein